MSRSYEIKERLGSGGFGEVYHAIMATNTGLRRDVAIKFVNHDITREQVGRLQDEAKLLSLLNHPGILTVYDLVELQGRYGLVTEYLDGADLSCCLSDLPPRAALQIVSKVAGALEAASHMPSDSQEPLSLIHRDIKPSNIRITKQGSVKLLDFGIAVSQHVDRSSKTKTGLVVGTPGYLAPERLTDGSVGPPSDIYGLGCVLFECLDGQPLFLRRENSHILIFAVLQEEHDKYIADRLATLSERFQQEVVEVIRSTLSYQASLRPTLRELEQILIDLSESGKMPGSDVRSWCRQRSWPEKSDPNGALSGKILQETESIPNAMSQNEPGPSRMWPVGVAGLVGLGFTAIAGITGSLIVGLMIAGVGVSHWAADEALNQTRSALMVGELDAQSPHVSVASDPEHTADQSETAEFDAASSSQDIYGVEEPEPGEEDRKEMVPVKPRSASPVAPKSKAAKHPRITVDSVPNGAYVSVVSNDQSVQTGVTPATFSVRPNSYTVEVTANGYTTWKQGPLLVVSGHHNLSAELTKVYDVGVICEGDGRVKIEQRDYQCPGRFTVQQERGALQVLMSYPDGEQRQVPYRVHCDDSTCASLFIKF